MADENYRIGIMANVATNLNKLATTRCAHEMKIFPIAFMAGEGVAKKHVFGGEFEAGYKLQALLATSTDSVEHLLSVYVAIGYAEPRTELLIGSVKIPANAGNIANFKAVDCWCQFRFSWQAQASRHAALFMHRWQGWRDSIAYDPTSPSMFDDVIFRVKLAPPVSAGAQVSVFGFVDSY